MASRTSGAAIDSLFDGMNASIKNFTLNAGIAQGQNNSNTDYADANAKFQQLATLQEEYQNLLKELTGAVKQMSGDSDVTNKLRQAGQLRGDITNLEKELATVKQESETSQARQLSVEKPREEASWYQGFGGMIGFTNPLRQISIPFLIALGLLFLYFSGLMLKDFFAPPTGTYTNSSVYQQGGIFSVFSDSRFYAVMGGVLLTGVVLGVLAYTGRLGKTVR